MKPLQLISPFPFFYELDGTPLDNGYIYVGEAGEDPEENPIAIYSDEAKTIEIAQPVRTSNGRAVLDGTPTRIFVGEPASVQIESKDNSFIDYQPLAFGVTASNDPSSVPSGRYEFEDLPGLLADGVPSDVRTARILTGVDQGLYLWRADATEGHNPTGHTGNGRWVLMENSGITNVQDLGAVGDGVTDDTLAIQAALDRKGAVYFPYTGSDYMHNGTLQQGSDTHVYTDYARATLSVLPTASFDAWGLKIRTAENSSISGLKLDGKNTRLPQPFSFTGAEYGSGVIVQDSKNITIKKVHLADWMKHGLDVTADNYSINDDPTLLVTSGRSSHVLITECSGNGAGDDNFTIHQSDYITIDNCRSEYPSGLYVSTNSNCYEIDDGSRHVTVKNSYGKGGTNGVQCKGHSNAAAPSNVTIKNMHIEECGQAIDCYHSGFHGEGDGGQSVTANELTIKNIHIKKPVSVRSSPVRFGRVRSYTNVTIDGIFCSDSVGLENRRGGLYLGRGLRGASVKNIFFKDCELNDGVNLYGNYEDVRIEGITLSDCVGVRTNEPSTDEQPVALATSKIDGFTGSGISLIDSPLFEKGEINGTVFNSSKYGDTVDHRVHQTTSFGDNPAEPNIIGSYGWKERDGYNIGEGEGDAIDYTAQLNDDTGASTMIRIQSYKANSLDTSKASNLRISVSTDEGATLTNVLEINSEGFVGITLGNYTNDTTAAEAGVGIGQAYRTGSTPKVRVI